MNLRKKTVVFLLALAMVSFLGNCAQELPTAELALAKSQVERAERLSCGEFAAEECSEAKRSLTQANDYAAEEKASEAKKSADYAISKAFDALEKTLPKLAARSREEAVAAIDSADDALASEYSPDDFRKAKEAKEKGEKLLSNADTSLAAYLREDKDEAAKEVKRTVALQEYEEAHNQFQEAAKLGKSAQSLALQNSGAILQSANEVEANLEKASAYSKGTNPEIEAEKNRISEAKSEIESGKLKSASAKIAQAKQATGALLEASVRDHAKERNLQAKEIVEDANVRFAEIKPEALPKNTSPEAYASTKENLGAANESLVASTTLLEQEKFEDSIAQSEEAIRLAEISIDQVASIQGKTSDRVSKKEMVSEKTEPKDAEKTEADSSQVENLSGGWKRYTVKQADPAECLWRIAEREDIYDNAKLWPRIYQANKKSIRNKNLIYPKQKLNIPPKEGSIGKAPKE